MLQVPFIYKKPHRVKTLCGFYAEGGTKLALQSLCLADPSASALRYPAATQKPKNLSQAGFLNGFCPLRLQVPLFFTNIKDTERLLCIFYICRRRDLNPHDRGPLPPQDSVSANSTTPACNRFDYTTICRFCQAFFIIFCINY